jgi:hypothetical protein
MPYVGISCLSSLPVNVALVWLAFWYICDCFSDNMAFIFQGFTNILLENIIL